MLKIIFGEQYLNYSFGRTHPFWPGRAVHFLELAIEKGLLFDLIPPEKAQDGEILMVHTPNYLQRLKKMVSRGGGYLSFDTPVTSQNLEAAYYSVGGTIKASALALGGALAINTLGGWHHAESNDSSGFCIFNDHAIAIRKFQKEGSIKTAAVLDLDVHAGNGTQQIFYDDPSVLTVSIHQDPTNFYPGTGFSWQRGEGRGEGFNLNFPLPGGTREKEYLEILDEALNKISDFKHDLLVVILGVDTYKEDLLASFQLENSTYGKIARKLKNWSPKVILCAGGYSKEVPQLWYEFVKGCINP